MQRLTRLVAALLTFAAVGCGGSQIPPMPPELSEAVSVGLCARALLQGVDPEQLTLAQARELAKALRGCGKPAHTAADAGT